LSGIHPPLHGVGRWSVLFGWSCSVVLFFSDLLNRSQFRRPLSTVLDSSKSDPAGGQVLAGRRSAQRRTDEAGALFFLVANFLKLWLWVSGSAFFSLF